MVRTRTKMIFPYPVSIGSDVRWKAWQTFDFLVSALRTSTESMTKDKLIAYWMTKKRKKMTCSVLRYLATQSQCNIRAFGGDSPWRNTNVTVPEKDRRNQLSVIPKSDLCCQFSTFSYVTDDGRIERWTASQRCCRRDKVGCHSLQTIRTRRRKLGIPRRGKFIQLYMLQISTLFLLF